MKFGNDHTHSGTMQHILIDPLSHSPVNAPRRRVLKDMIYMGILIWVSAPDSIMKYGDTVRTPLRQRLRGIKVHKLAFLLPR